jgi:hypothetical protein
MIPEVKLTKESVWGSWYSNTDRNYQGEAIIEFESARIRNITN